MSCLHMRQVDLDSPQYIMIYTLCIQFWCCGCESSYLLDIVFFRNGIGLYICRYLSKRTKHEPSAVV